MLKTKKTYKVEQFLSLFGKNKIVCTSNGVVANSPMTVNPIDVALRQNEKMGSDVYFYVNTGGTKQNQITHINASFVDLDAGRDTKGKYYNDSIVSKKKVAMLNAISKCPIKPTVYVETRNGYQLYWVYTRPISALDKTSWSVLQNKICNHFVSVGADSRVLKINQVLRVPHTLWHKKYEGKSPFLTKVSTVGKKYTFNQVASAFKSEKTVKPTGNSWSIQKKTVGVKVTTGYGQTANIADFKNSNVQKVDSRPTSVYNKDVLHETADFLKEVNKILYYGGHKFLAQQALRLAGELETQSTLEVK